MMYFNAIDNAFQYNAQSNADMHIDNVFKSQYRTYPTYGSLPGPQYHHDLLETTFEGVGENR